MMYDIPEQQALRSTMAADREASSNAQLRYHKIVSVRRASRNRRNCLRQLDRDRRSIQSSRNRTAAQACTPELQEL
jgi:hypothetical protein